MDYSLVSGIPEGFVETPFVMIEQGDNFITEGDSNLWRSITGTYKSESGEAWVMEAENADFETRSFGHSKAQLGYAPKYYVMAEGRASLDLDSEQMP